MNDDVLLNIFKTGIVPVVALNDVSEALPTADALISGGINCIEVTFRTLAAEKSIDSISKQKPKMLIGAGTVLSVDQVDKAIDSGAKFLVTPGTNKKVIEYCIKKGILIIPGCSTPSDIETAIEFGLNVVKFFPSELLGGINMIKAISAAYSGVKFLPTGGINLKNLNSYFSFNKIIACGGTWIANNELIKNKKYDEIIKLSKEALRVMFGFEVHHIGINSIDINIANKIIDKFRELFLFEKKEKSKSFFVGDNLEVMKSNFLGKHGHISISTTNVLRAVYYLEKKGIVFDKNTESYDKLGNLSTVYLKEEIGCFAIHLIKKQS
jgi:2-dehydro-3-deoxyphosphogluconate aldolase/(4S)-4-hydroxy-2-oxoglutarate aldolase